MEMLFWSSVFLAMFSYFFYPLTLLLMSSGRRQKVHRSLDYIPNVTLVITVHNEERRINEKLENTLSIDYPSERFQILVASDGSTDATNAIVKTYADRGIELLDLRERGGKENAQRQAVQNARGEIIVFTDVATRVDSMGIRHIVSNFADASIGCVSSVDRVMSLDGSSSGGEGAYVRYEMWLRQLESTTGSVVGLSGSFFAARKEVCRDFSTSMPSDFRTLLNSKRLGLRGISDPNAVGFYPSIKNEAREFDRKVRTVLRGITTFFNHLEFMNLFRFGLFSYQYIAHKLMRWLTPFFLLLALAAHVFLAIENAVYAWLLLFHSMAYMLALLGFFSRSASSIAAIRIPKYFLIVNYSILVAWVKYLSGRRQIIWNPSVR